MMEYLKEKILNWDRDANRNELLRHVQGTMTVAEYETYEVQIGYSIKK